MLFVSTHSLPPASIPPVVICGRPGARAFGSDRVGTPPSPHLSLDASVGSYTVHLTGKQGSISPKAPLPCRKGKKETHLSETADICYLIYELDNSNPFYSKETVKVQKGK